MEPPPLPILGASNWTSNSELIADVASLHLTNIKNAIDLTYGRGNWWKNWRPDPLITNDLYLETTDIDFHYDFTDLPEEWANQFDLVAYDPPYVSVGGRRDKEDSEFHNRYGLLSDRTRTPAILQELINDGLSEAYRLSAPKGITLAKCQDYISSGKFWPGTHYTLTHALQLGYTLIDRFEHLSGIKPQPPNRTQKHARRNHSTLFVLRKAS